MSTHIISPGDPGYTETVSDLDQGQKSPRFDYSEIEQNYNKAEIGSVFFLGMSEKSKTSNVVTAMRSRGLQQGKDCLVRVSKKDFDGSEPPEGVKIITIRKLSPSPITSI